VYNQNINLSEPYISKKEIKYLSDCIKNNSLTIGKYISKFENAISKYTNSKYVCSCINGTSALHLALKVLGIERNFEVIVPTLTFISTINAVIYNNANPIFMDADNFYNIDSNKTLKFILNETLFKTGFSFNRKTKRRVFAIIITHVWGNAAQIEEIIKICKKRNIKVVEDAAESLGTKYTEGKYRDKHTGTIGDIGCLSFNGNKIITSAGGGMLISNNKKYILKAKYYINQSKNDGLYYKHNEVGYNYRLSNIHAAIGLAQFENFEKILKLKKTIHLNYKKAFLKIDGIKFSNVPHYAKNNYWLNLIQIDEKIYNHSIHELIKIFDNNNIQIRPVWLLNHKQKMFKKYQNFEIDNANKLIKKSLCVPSSSNLKFSEFQKIIKLFNDKK
jgi:perosamine synthetase